MRGTIGILKVYLVLMIVIKGQSPLQFSAELTVFYHFLEWQQIMDAYV